MSFIDEVILYIKAGDGGNGCTSFRREKFIEFGGPNGGNGGRGGDIIFISDMNLNSLLHFRDRQSIKADNGKHGRDRNRTGAVGQDVLLRVPIGTQIIDNMSKEIIDTLDIPHKQCLVAQGGKGGFGNAYFRSSINQAPKNFTYGILGQDKNILLNLIMIADIGIIGMPNAGKSKFLTRCSDADTKVGSYPFTTVRPHLGVAYVDTDALLIVDIPGIINRAHLGEGLGHKFLKHIEKCKILLHLIDATHYDIIATYNCIYHELTCYNKHLIQKEEVVVLNKCDLLTEQERLKKKEYLVNYLNKEVLCLSLHDNLQYILNFLNKKLLKQHNSIITEYHPINV
ncbi:Obg family GTPase CgtA [Wolbachia endosymbiont of Howardula sp.]|uniref:Obg family GTPase CgtA n=1 Tax=Wolbachia endosymbiont of Howardula sp. TaxID=2916816 RepID=UPI00217D3D26|nr:GTPase ObgE [Wolbachia endosymbiont of Howardula sp.]UWI83195.1 GTPase ObgE [Wolbachia endosymbiont of Howardula sp.]